jgi:hypothetical protein
MTTTTKVTHQPAGPDPRRRLRCPASSVSDHESDGLVDEDDDIEEAAELGDVVEGAPVDEVDVVLGGVAGAELLVEHPPAGINAGHTLRVVTR